jgi:cell division protein FtsZ
MSGLLFQFDDESQPGAVIRVVGVGGAGGNAVDRMIQSQISGVSFTVINTDVQALCANSAPVKVQIGKTLTRGLGAGADPQIAMEAVSEDRDEIQSILEGADMVFVTAGMGGGTGTGAAPEIAKMAREAGALTVGVVTKPFNFEGKPRMRKAEAGITKLKDNVDTLILVPNQRLLSIVDSKTNLGDAFKIADDVLMSAVRGISDLLTIPGLINLDFADVRAVMKVPGEALMGVGSGRGQYAAVEAAEQAISSPLLDEYSIKGAKALLVNITGGDTMSLADVSEASSAIVDLVGDEADIFFGAVTSQDLGEEIRVTVIATGIEPELQNVPLINPRTRISKQQSRITAVDHPSHANLDPHDQESRDTDERIPTHVRANELRTLNETPQTRSSRGRSSGDGTMVINWDDGNEEQPTITRRDPANVANPFIAPEPEEILRFRNTDKETKELKPTGKEQEKQVADFRASHDSDEQEDLELPTFLRRTMD